MLIKIQHTNLNSDVVNISVDIYPYTYRYTFLIFVNELYKLQCLDGLEEAANIFEANMQIIVSTCQEISWQKKFYTFGRRNARKNILPGN